MYDDVAAGRKAMGSDRCASSLAVAAGRIDARDGRGRPARVSRSERMDKHRL